MNPPLFFKYEKTLIALAFALAALPFAGMRQPKALLITIPRP